MNTTTALRALAQHLERHQLDDDAISRAAVDYRGDLDVQIHAAEGVDMRALIARWADTIPGAAITAKPVDASFHVHVTGTIGGLPITVVCVASGERADQIRAALGLPALPTLPTGGALLDMLTTRKAAA